jgi:hypothetical protein
MSAMCACWCCSCWCWCCSCACCWRLHCICTRGQELSKPRTTAPSSRGCCGYPEGSPWKTYGL